jgi:hypothetical protein
MNPTLVACLRFHRRGPNPAVLALNETAINKEDVVTANADNLLMAFAGTFSGTPADGLTRTVLIKTSKHSGLVDGMTASFAGAQIASELPPSSVEYPLAIRLTGPRTTRCTCSAKPDKYIAACPAEFPPPTIATS